MSVAQEINLNAGPITPIRLRAEPSPVRLVASPSRILVQVSPQSIGLRAVPEKIVLKVTGVGTQGPPGASDQLEYATAGETISALKPVVIINGLAFLADSSNSSHRGFFAGVAVTAATIGHQVGIRNGGLLQDLSWNWDISKPWIFVGQGVLTQTPPGSGWLQSIARVESTNVIFVQPCDVYQRA
jgi:hypothetical protein